MTRFITSNISPDKTIMEIEQILAKFGAQAIMKEYNGGQVVSLSFYIIIKEKKIPFKMPMDVDRAKSVVRMAVQNRELPRNHSYDPKLTEKALIVGWRLIKEWIHVNLSLMEIEFADPLQVLLPFAYNPLENKTVYELFVDNQDKLLGLEGPQHYE